jgi:hypothetical protein
VKREDKFVLSHKQFAIDPESFRTDEHHGSQYAYVNAIWFKRKNGLLTAHRGRLWDYFGGRSGLVADLPDFLARIGTQRYGGNFEARYDGVNYRGTENVKDMLQDIELLGAALDAHPNVPGGYDGWWVF